MKTKTRMATLILAVFLSAGCAAYRPVFDPMFITNTVQFEKDLKECQEVGATQRATAGEGAAIGGAAGGLLGAGMGGAFGSIWRDAGRGAAAGAIAGAIGGIIGGALRAQEVQRQITVNCMAGRGYRPLQ